MLRDLAFDEPARLWLLVVPVLLVGTVLLRRHLRDPAQAYAEPALRASVAPHRLGWRRPVAAVGLLAAVVALTTAFAQPSVLAEDARERAVVLVALDTSSSMMATDVAPDRFTAAKAAAQAFVRALPPEVDVGLVAYNATAVLVAPPTEQHERVAAAVDDLTMSGGTAAGDALRLSLDAVLAELGTAADEQRPAARIVLLADGDSTVGTPLAQAAQTVAAARVPVSTIAYGTADGVVVADGVTYRVPVDVAALRQVAETTGGTAYAAASAAQLRAVYDDIGTALETQTRRREVADLFAGMAVALLFSTAVPSLAWSGRLA